MSGESDSFFDEASAFVVGPGIVTFALFPLAVPLIVLTAVVLIPFLAVGLVLAVVAGPVVLIARRRRRRGSGVRFPTTEVRARSEEPAGVRRLTGCHPMI